MIEKTALIVVDVQNDFIDGSLAVPNAINVIEPINQMIKSDYFDEIFYTQDMHPLNHGSFAEIQGVEPFTLGELNGVKQIFWPSHCVARTRGCEIHKDLIVEGFVFEKGTNKDVDSYSCFTENNGTTTAFNTILCELNVKKIYVCGIATDYCVKHTALDAEKLGYETFLIENCCAGVNEETTKQAIKEMTSKGVSILQHFK